MRKIRNAWTRYLNFINLFFLFIVRYIQKISIGSRANGPLVKKPKAVKTAAKYKFLGFANDLYRNKNVRIKNNNCSESRSADLNVCVLKRNVYDDVKSCLVAKMQKEAIVPPQKENSFFPIKNIARINKTPLTALTNLTDKLFKPIDFEITIVVQYQTGGFSKKGSPLSVRFHQSDLFMLSSTTW